MRRRSFIEVEGASVSGSERSLRHQGERWLREGVLGVSEYGTYVACAGGNVHGEGGGKGGVVGDRDLAIVQHPHVEVVQVQSRVRDGNQRLAGGKVDGENEVGGHRVRRLGGTVKSEGTVAGNHRKQ